MRKRDLNIVVLQKLMRNHPLGSDLRLIPFIVCASIEGSGKTARIRMLTCLQEKFVRL